MHPQGKGAAAKSKPPAPKPPAKPGKAGKGDVLEEAPKLERGFLQAVLPLRASTASRDWLRNGAWRGGLASVWKEGDG